VLRTRFDEVEGRPVQIVDSAGRPEIALVDLGGLASERREPALLRLVAEQSARPFDLASGPLLRVMLFHLGPQVHLALTVVHHAVADGWSFGIFLHELEALYASRISGRPAGLPDLPVQYADFAVWQRKWISGEVLERKLGFWRQYLAGVPPVLTLADRQRPARKGFRAGTWAFRIPARTLEAFASVGRRGDATLFMALLAVFSTLLSRASGQDDLAVGTPVANRDRPEIEGLIGMFVNTLAVRAELSGDPTFPELLERVRRRMPDLYANQDIPFERVVDELGLPRSLSHAPLVQVALVLRSYAPVQRAPLAGIAFESLAVEAAGAQFDLTLVVTGGEGDLRCHLEYDRDLFDPAAAQRLAQHFNELVQGVASDPGRRLSELPLLSQAERHQLLEWTEGAAYARELCLHELFAARAAEAPDSIAVKLGDERLTYRELDEASNRLARHLRRQGVGPDIPVGLCVQRSLAMVVGILGILKAGGAYVPLDPDYPKERLAFLLQDALGGNDVPVLLTQSDLEDRLPPQARLRRILLDDPEAFAGESPAPLRGLAQPESLAYVIYTSGSTGRPKGVLISHANVVRLFSATQAWFRFGPGDVWTLFHSSAFDFSVWEIWGALLFGGRLVVVPWWVSRSPDELLDLLQCERVTVLNQTPSAFRQLVRAEGDLALRLVIFGGEALDLSALEPWWERYGEGEPRLVNMYGITETTVHVTYRPVFRDDLRHRHRSPIGRAIPDLQLHLLDSRLRPVPVGAPGEIHVGGAGLARGYQGRPDLTAERFIPDASAGRRGDPGARLYRTGDLGRWLPDGQLEYLGRIDLQVKIRGFRIELGEIEGMLSEHPDVRQAVAFAIRTAGETALVACVVPREGTCDPAELKRWSRTHLPEHMVPAFILSRPELPLLPSGKVDRGALSQLDPASGPESNRTFTAPRGPLEELLADCFAEVLGRGRVSAEESFFDLGGHSLLAVQVVSRLRNFLGIEVPLRVLFEAPTVRGLALAVALNGTEGVAAPPILPVPRTRELPLSFAQERLWFLDQLVPGSSAYNLPLALGLRGALDRAAFAASLAALVERHEALRTTFADHAGRPVQEIAAPRPFGLPFVDLVGLAPASRDGESLRLVTEEASRPFDLARGPVFRTALLRLEEKRFLALLTLHHITADGWSLGILVRELGMLYPAFLQGRRPALPDLPVQYADFATWQRTFLSGGALARELGWWRERLAGAPAVLELPLDRPRPPVQSFHGGRVPAGLPEELSRTLANCGRKLGATPFMVLLAAFHGLLGRISSGQEDVVTGTAVANRNRVETEPVVGFFVNTLALRGDLSGNPPFSELVARARSASLEAHGHQDLPFERLVEEIQPERSLAHAPVVQVMLGLQNAPVGPLDLPGLTLEAVQAGPGGSVKFDLSLHVATGAGRMAGTWEYNSDLFDAVTVKRMAGHFETLLAAALAHPDLRLSELPVLAEAEWHQLRAEWCGAAASRPARGMIGLFEERASAAPEAVAVAFDRETLTYGELDRRADGLARRLRRLGVGPEMIIGLRLERSLDLVVGLLGIWKAGGVWLPLDPSYPEERLTFLVEDSGAALVLTEVEGEDGPDLGPELDPTSPAYVIYTSGSTGLPKGVVVEHGSLAHTLAASRDAFDWNADDSILVLAPFSFDIVLFELLSPLLAGGSCRLVGLSPALDVGEVVRLLPEFTRLHAVPAVMRQIVEVAAGRSFPRLRTLFVGGDTVAPELLGRMAEVFPGAELRVLYGP
ncbi:MAG TPA: amino acid adenylation domain-containing protein, partial [Thermoanaerobaculia bacterium]|nr:amino acid adenylation domain-containing protein [Thermoanaerobaculia bacterium]